MLLPVFIRLPAPLIMPEKVLSLLSPAVKVFVLAMLIVPAPLIEATVSSEFTLYVAPELTATAVESDNVPEIAKVPAVIFVAPV